LSEQLGQGGPGPGPATELLQAGVVDRHDPNRDDRRAPASQPEMLVQELEIQRSNESRLKEEEDGEDRRRGARDDLGAIPDTLPHPAQPISHAITLVAHSAPSGNGVDGSRSDFHET